jgi:DNA-binding NarL/FixJ family response regulator
VTGHSTTLPRLTDRERQVLALVADGRTNPQIAAELGVTLSTAKNQVEHVITKLGAENRWHAIRLAFEAGEVW